MAGLNLFNYVGVLLGAALTGIIADATNMRIAIAVPVALVLGILFVARAYGARSPSAPVESVSSQQ